MTAGTVFSEIRIRLAGKFFFQAQFEFRECAAAVLAAKPQDGSSACICQSSERMN